MAASPAKKGEQQSVDAQQTTDIPAPKKASHPRKPKVDNVTLQPADAAPATVRDKAGRFVKKEKALPTPTQKSAPTPAAVPKGAEAGATAKCKDGSFSHSQQHSGSCSRHGGVAQWLN
ncbi:TPA: DUF3761 domain-containing protein [Serratia marcescens]|nr:DUF3761 domain-containing protein [Serratia marcescens]HBC7420631.1 DUF3761 domain-containing protein [Serratia marcescens]